MRRIALVCAVLLGLGSVADAATKRYAVIVAHNRSLDKNVTPLEFADDDGARYWELFSQLADDTKLLTVLDASSQRSHRLAARAALAPTRAQLLRTIAGVFARAKADVARGDKVVFTFILIGHGEIGAGGEGYVSLADAPFTRTDLFREVLAKSPATVNHVIVDACNAYFLVHRRGGKKGAAGPSHRSAVEAFLKTEDKARYPNTGFILSTSAEKDSHEWSAYRAGVFSHQLRSALSGAADANGDGRVEYSEVQAFVAAANLRVADARAQVEMHAAPPAIDASRPLVDLTASKFRHWLAVPKGEFRFYVEDDRGVRYADVNASGERPLLLALVPRRHYFVRSHDGRRELRVDLSREGRVSVHPKMMHSTALASRGALAESFRRQLFAEPYGMSFYKGYMANRGLTPVLPASQRFWPKVASVDNEQFDDLLARTSEMAARDPRLKERLRVHRQAILEALHNAKTDQAAELLDEATFGE